MSPNTVPTPGKGLPPRAVRGLAALGIVGLALGSPAGSTGCAGPGHPDGVVAASLPPIASLVNVVAGDRLQTLSLLPPGRSPHDYEPTPAELGRLRHAVLFVEAGTGVDAWMRRAAVAVMGDSVQVLTLVSGMASSDLHPWLDPDRVRAFLPVLARRLAEIDPEGAPEFQRRAAAAAETLAAIDAEARTRLAGADAVPFALLHPAFAPLVAHWGLHAIGVLEPHPEGESSPRTLGQVAAGLRGTRPGVIFVEPQLGRRQAEALAADTGARIALLDPLGGPDAPGRTTYFDLLRWNLRELAEALDAGGH